MIFSDDYWKQYRTREEDAYDAKLEDHLADDCSITCEFCKREREEMANVENSSKHIKR